MKLFAFLFGLIAVLCGGCVYTDIVEIGDPTQPLNLPTGTLPQAMDDPTSTVTPPSPAVTTEKNTPVNPPADEPDETPSADTPPAPVENPSAPAETPEVPAEPPAPSPAVAPVPPEPAEAAPATPAVAPAPVAPNPAPRPASPESYRRGPGIWRAFSRLSQEEQAQLLRLQRNDPERFRSIMLEKADQLYAAEIAKLQALDELATRCRQCTDPEEKARLTAELREKLREDFQQRLQDTRRDIEYTKRKAAALEAELSRRESNCDAIVEALLQNKLSGNPPPPRPQH
jgi:O6-methylguanine-DNA--protein-cysteine methyltransferase